MTQTPCEKGYFVQYPYLLIEHPDLTRDDGWLLLSLMKDHRTEEPFYMSYREMEIASRVARNLLSSYTDKKTGKFHEGCVDRIARVTGYMSYTTGREIGKDGAPKGNSKLCITIHHGKIWQGNRQYCETRTPNPVSHRDRLGLYDKPVSYGDRFSEEPVSNQDNPVPMGVNLVSHRDKPVSYADKLVSYRDTSYPLTQLVEPVDILPIDKKDITDINIRKNDESPRSPSTDPPFHSSSNLTFHVALGSSENESPTGKSENVGAFSANVNPENFALHTSMQQSNNFVAQSQDVSVEIRESLSLGGERKIHTVWIEDKPHENAQINYSLMSADHALALLNQLEQQRPALEQIARGDDTLTLAMPPVVAVGQDDHAQNVPVSSVAGQHEGEPSDPPDSDASIPQEAILNQSLAVGCQVGRSKIAQNNAKNACSKLVSIITSLEDVRTLYDAAREFYGRDKVIWVTNLAEDRVIKKLQASQQESQFWKDLSERQAQESMHALPSIESMVRPYPGLQIAEWNDGGRSFRVIWFGEGQEDYLLVESLAQWEEMQADQQGQDFLNFAQEWGKSLQQKLPEQDQQEQVEEIPQEQPIHKEILQEVAPQSKVLQFGTSRVQANKLMDYILGREPGLFVDIDDSWPLVFLVRIWLSDTESVSLESLDDWAELDAETLGQARDFALERGKWNDQKRTPRMGRAMALSAARS